MAELYAHRSEIFYDDQGRITHIKYHYKQLELAAIIIKVISPSNPGIEYFTIEFGVIYQNVFNALYLGGFNSQTYPELIEKFNPRLGAFLEQLYLETKK